jgi:peptidoglycan/LPS O-acetylase OafA/YrhL
MIATSLSGPEVAAVGAVFGLAALLYCVYGPRGTEPTRKGEHKALTVLVAVIAGVVVGGLAAMIASNIIW